MCQDRMNPCRDVPPEDDVPPDIDGGQVGSSAMAAVAS
jgi:hypothetical protein